MDVKMQTSFIPKKPITETRMSGSGVSLFLLLSIILFIVSITLAGAVYLWQKKLVGQIETAKASLAAAKDSYEEDTINPLIRLNDRIEQSKILLTKHIAVSPVFLMLQKIILRNIQLKDMKFAYGTDGKIKITLSGTAQSYDALSRQSDAFGSDTLKPFISAPVVSDFSPTANGSISFNFNATVDPKLVSYGNTLNQ